MGREAAFGVPALRIPAPDIESGSTELFSSWIDRSWFAGRRVDRGLAYGQAKLLGALWIGDPGVQDNASEAIKRFVSVTAGALAAL